jgi:hypothetical protein
LKLCYSCYWSKHNWASQIKHFGCTQSDTNVSISVPSKNVLSFF